LSLVKEEQQQQLSLLKSIPGIGTKTALFLIVITDGFLKFENASQLCSYAGITLTIREPGSNVKGRSRISKVGNRKFVIYSFYVRLTLVNTTKLVERFMNVSLIRERVKN